jgi:hypothetical protein
MLAGLDVRFLIGGSYEFNKMEGNISSYKILCEPNDRWFILKQECSLPRVASHIFLLPVPPKKDDIFYNAHYYDGTVTVLAAFLLNTVPKFSC